MIFTSISPNAESDDVRLALSLLFRSWTWKRAAPRKELENVFSEYLSGEHTFAFESGRTSLAVLLSVLGLAKDDEVLVQAYTCVAVPEPVLWNGLKPVYVDCLDDFTMNPEDLKKKISPKSRVLIIQHTFGKPAHINELIEIARMHTLFVIEDCAHALGAEYHGKKVGTFGDASFFSFGRDKVISSVFGGMLAVKDAELAGKIARVYDGLPEASYVWIKRQLNHVYFFAIGKALYDIAQIGKIFLKVSGMLRVFSRAVEPTERAGGVPSFAYHKMPGALAMLALHQFKKLDRFNNHRIELAKFYSANLSGPVSSKDEKNIFLRYTVMVESPKKVANALKTKGILVGDWYTESIAPAGVQYGKIGYEPSTCPNAERLAQHSLNLPTAIGTSLKEAQYVVEKLKNI